MEPAHCQLHDPRWKDLTELVGGELRASSDPANQRAAACLQRITASADLTHSQAAWRQVLPCLVTLVATCGGGERHVQRAVCALLRVASYGTHNVDNKKTIAESNGVTVIVERLNAEAGDDVAEMLTAILWNLSSCSDLKRSIIDKCISQLVPAIVIPFAEAVMAGGLQSVDRNSIAVFSNTCGVLRSLSSEGAHGRRVLRECDGLVEAVLVVVSAAVTDQLLVDDCLIEHCVCLLRNISFACQEVVEPHYLDAKSRRPAAGSASHSCCLCKKHAKHDDEDERLVDVQSNVDTGCHPRGMELLWQPEITRVYLPLLSNSANVVTVEAALGSLQNLTACTWKPAGDIRTAVRTDKGLPVIINMLSPSHVTLDVIARTAAICLRNLAIDPKNKELIGKYALSNLVSYLPAECHVNADVTAESARDAHQSSNETLCAVISTLTDLVADTTRSCKQLLDCGGVHRLMVVTSHPTSYSAKVFNVASRLLQLIWNCREIRPEFGKYHWTKADFFPRQSSTSRSRAGTAAVAGAETTKPRRRIVFHRRIATDDGSHLFCIPPTSPDSIPSPTGFDNLGPEANDIPNSGQSPVQCAPTSSPASLTAGTKPLSSCRNTSTTAGNHVTFSLPPENNVTRQQPRLLTTTNVSSTTDIEDDCCDRFLRNHLADVNLSPVSTRDVLPMKRFVGDGTVQCARTRHLPHRTPDRTAPIQNTTDSWV